MPNVVAPYQPYPWQVAALNDRSPVLLATGSAGGGKSRFAAEKINAFMLHYPGARGLLVRYAREFASKSMVPALRRAVGSASLARYLKAELMFEYANGSRAAVAGVKDENQRQALRSIFEDGGVDMVWIEEANAITFEAYQEIKTRMRGKAAHWRQILLTTNPDAPGHWIHQNLILGGEASVYYSSAVDNPANPPGYQQTLNSLTGTQYERLVLGKWVQAEGVVYDNFRLEYNVTTDADYRDGDPVYWGVDDGYAAGGGVGTPGHHPRVVLFAQQRSGGRIDVFDEIYETLELPEATLAAALARPYAAPRLVRVDSSATVFRRRLGEAGLRNTGATHAVTEGIKVVRRFIGDGQGVRQLRIHPRCANLIRELQSYRYDDRKAAVVGGERPPLKQDDHAPDALRYLLWQWR